MIAVHFLLAKKNFKYKLIYVKFRRIVNKACFKFFFKEIND